MPNPNSQLPPYAQNAPAGPTPHGIQLVDNSHKLVKGMTKMAKLPPVKRLARSLLRRLSLPKTNRRRYF